MGLGKRILHTTANNLMMAFSTGLGAFLAVKTIPFLVNAGLISVTVVMK